MLNSIAILQRFTLKLLDGGSIDARWSLILGRPKPLLQCDRGTGDGLLGLVLSKKDERSLVVS